MTRDSFILPELLLNSVGTGVLDTPERVLQASEELVKVTADDFENFRLSRQRSLEESTRLFLD